MKRKQKAEDKKVKVRRDVEIRICDRCKKEIMLDRYKSGYSEALRAWKEGPIKDTDLCPECYKLYSKP